MASDYRQSHLGSEKAESYHRGFSESYHGSMMWRLEQRILGRIIRRYYRDRDVLHLDFACGTGRILSFFENWEQISSVGVDLSPEMLKVARQHVRHSELLEADITRNDALADRTFDLITAFRFFPNAEPELRLEAMRALIRHLRRGGKLVFNNHKSRSGLMARLAKWRKPEKWGAWGMGMDEVRRLLSETGLQIEKIYHAGVVLSLGSRLLLPRRLLGIMEVPLSRCGALRGIAENLIFVCRPAGPVG